MFRQLATAVAPAFGNDPVAAANAVLTGQRPSQVSEYLEAFWSAPRNAAFQQTLGIPALGQAAHLNLARPVLLDPNLAAGVLPPGPPANVQVAWHHLVYAALLDQTRLMEICRRIVYEAVHGERLPRPGQLTQNWLHATEQIFFGGGWSYSVRNVTSSLRPDPAAVHRNAYFRMFGWVHAAEDGRPSTFVRPETVNRDFSSLFEALIAEVWRGYQNRFNLVGANDTDDDAIATLVRRLNEMLLSRRFAGALSREEFDAVATASWFHLAVEYDTQIVTDFNAQSGGIADRVRKLGQLVGLPSHARTDAFFQLALPMSVILRAIESGAVAAAGPASLYAGAFAPDMLRVITHWSIATGREMKDSGRRQQLTQLLAAPAMTATGLPSRDSALSVMR